MPDVKQDEEKLVVKPADDEDKTKGGNGDSDGGGDTLPPDD